MCLLKVAMPMAHEQPCLFCSFCQLWQKEGSECLKRRFFQPVMERPRVSVILFYFSAMFSVLESAMQGMLVVWQKCQVPLLFHLRRREGQDIWHESCCLHSSRHVRERWREEKMEWRRERMPVEVPRRSGCCCPLPCCLPVPAPAPSSLHASLSVSKAAKFSHSPFLKACNKSFCKAAHSLFCCCGREEGLTAWLICPVCPALYKCLGSAREASLPM